MRHHTVDPDHAQKHGQGAKENHELADYAVTDIPNGYERFERFYRRDWLIAIHGPNRVANGRRCRRGVAGITHHEPKRRGGELCQRNVHLPLGLRAHIKHLDVVHDPHNGGDSMLVAKAQLLSDGIFIRPDLARKRLIDNYRRRIARLLIGGIEKAALYQPNLHCGKVIRRHSRVSSAESFSGPRAGLIDCFDCDSLTETTVRY